MAGKEFDSGSKPQGEQDPLSATGMFLNAFGPESVSAPDPARPDPGKPVPARAQPGAAWPAQTQTSQPQFPPQWTQPAAATPPTEPGEFTRLFKTLDKPAGQVQPSAQAPAPPPLETPPAPPGEFTRIFVKQATPPAELPARPVNSQPPLGSAAPGPPKLKGFSSPGVSDSASAEGGFTQYLRPRQAQPAPVPPVAHVQPVLVSPPPPPAPAKELHWEPEVRPTVSPAPGEPAGGSPSATGLLSSLSEPQQRHPDPNPFRPEPQSSFEPAPFSPSPAHTEPTPVSPGSITRLIQRLSEGDGPAPPAEPIRPSPVSASIPMPAATSGPGEFTRMISGDSLKAATASTPAPSPAPAPPPAAAWTAPPLPPPPPAPAPVAFQAPKVEPPKIAPPAIALPAPPAPKGKLEGMVPILLVINTFLLLVLLVVTIFALKGR